ncbi:hypothetical protein BFS06_11930 [Clostridium perfringens]|uniref:Uncharacterized protein n=1 Tax=Clostridium perfringens TaxID=1502 RepID=A0A140GS91_CLOPF|nr:hypothetical protein [Clostridium perfringens]AMN31400.1 hypothetical protein JFP838_pA0484 [Clostridium perfringens]TBX14911.1 hypothetical protein BFS06_11930 [Clostridium perfringens]
MDKKIKYIIVALVSLGVLGVVGTSYFAFKSKNKTKNNSEIVNTLPDDKKSTIQERVDYSDIKNKDGNSIKKEEKGSMVNSDVAIYENNKLILGNGDKEYPNDKAKKLLGQLKLYASNIEYDKIINAVRPYINDYRFSLGDNQEIATMYNDASLMLSIKLASDSAKGTIAKAMRNVEMKAVGSLMLPELSREELIIDQNSLTPIISGKPVIVSNEVINLNDKSKIKEEDKEKVEDIIENCDKLLSLHKLTLNLDKKNKVSAYMVCNLDGTVDIYGFYALNGAKTPYQTVAYWKEINKKIAEVS